MIKKLFISPDHPIFAMPTPTRPAFSSLVLIKPLRNQFFLSRSFFFLFLIFGSLFFCLECKQESDLCSVCGAVVGAAV
jgi:hypothetical protein